MTNIVLSWHCPRSVSYRVRLNSPLRYPPRKLACGGNIAVPARYWKVLLVLPFGEDDLTRISLGWFSGTTRVIAVDMPNTQSANALVWYDYRTSVDAIEDSTRAMRRCLDVLNALGTEQRPAGSGGGCGAGELRAGSLMGHQ